MSRRRTPRTLQLTTIGGDAAIRKRGKKGSSFDRMKEHLGKKPRSQENAEKNAADRQASGEAVEAYSCRFCEYFHVGHLPRKGR